MQKYFQIYCFFSLILLNFSCSRGSKNDLEEGKLLPNEVYISGFKNDAYVVAQNGRVIISPIIERENIKTESDLAFEWVIGDVVVSKERDLDIDLPYDVTNGEKRCQYKVVRSADGKSYENYFKINVTNPFGYGYYFLSVDKLGKTVLSHININENKGTVFHTTRIDGVYIGKNGNSLYANGRYNKPLQKVIYDLYITTEGGDNPHIITENITLSLLHSVSTSNVSLGFTPSSHTAGYQLERESFFISKGEIFEYKDNLLTRRPTAGYYWTDIVAGNNNLRFYAKDKSTGRFFVISTTDGYSVSPIQGGINFSDETIIATRLKNYYVDGLVADKIVLITYANNRLSTCVLDDGKIVRTGSVEVAGVFVSAISIDDDVWYIGCGSTVYRYNSKTNTISQHVVLDRTLGNITSLVSTSKSNTLIITTENSSSATSVSGSVVLYDNLSKNITSFPNVIYHCVGIVCCDEDKFD